MTKRRNIKKVDSISDLVRRAEAEGDEAALETLRKEHPEVLDNYMVILGDLRSTIESVLLDSFIGDDLPITRRGVELRLEALREELAGPCPSPLERLLVERIVISWVQANHSDLLAATSMKGEAPLKERQHHLKVQDRATKCFLNSCKVLAQVQKLLGPNIQVNIAERQVNVSPGGSK